MPKRKSIPPFRTAGSMAPDSIVWNGEPGIYNINSSTEGGTISVEFLTNLSGGVPTYMRGFMSNSLVLPKFQGEYGPPFLITGSGSSGEMM